MKKKVFTAIVLAAVMLALPAGTALMAIDTLFGQPLLAPHSGNLDGSGRLAQGVIPTFVITAVKRNQWVEIQTDNFPADDYFIVTMGAMGSKGANGVIIATTYSDEGNRFTMRYAIPAMFWDYKQIAIRLESPTSGYYAYNWFYNNDVNVPADDKSKPPVDSEGKPYNGYPTISIVGVVGGGSVTVKGHNFPANDDFFVRMNWIGTQGVAGAVVATFHSGPGGEFKETWAIPDFLKVASQIAIRLESPTSGYYAYNWFYNNSTQANDEGKQQAIPASYVGYPTFAITAVKRDKNVTILTHNLPPNDKFVVTMGVMGTRGVGGYWVDQFKSGDGGVQELKFKIPPQLFGSYQISIRIESPTTGYYAYNWFYNNTYPPEQGADPQPPAPAVPPYYGHPIFYIAAVDRNNTVRILPINFPPNDTFYVRMNWIGTRGEAGAVMQTVTTDANGNLSDLTYEIPGFLQGQLQIAIRLESPTTGYYAYNWFYNNDAVVFP